MNTTSHRLIDLMLFHGFSSSRYTLVEKLVSHWLPFGEVSFRPPFPTRPCEEGLCRSLPRALRERLQPIRQLRTEATKLGSRCPGFWMPWSIRLDSICWISKKFIYDNISRVARPFESLHQHDATGRSFAFCKKLLVI